mgnify:FL=1
MAVLCCLQESKIVVFCFHLLLCFCLSGPQWGPRSFLVRPSNNCAMLSICCPPLVEGKKLKMPPNIQLRRCMHSARTKGFMCHVVPPDLPCDPERVLVRCPGSLLFLLFFPVTYFDKYNNNALSIHLLRSEMCSCWALRKRWEYGDIF